MRSLRPLYGYLHPGRLPSRPIPLFALCLMGAALGCREDTESPTGPAPGPALATTAAAALAFHQVSTGWEHSCGVTTDNRAYCWGSNANRQLVPAAVEGGLTISQVSAGAFHTCGKTPAAVASCWGRGFSGQLGNGGASSSSTPVPVVGPM